MTAPEYDDTDPGETVAEYIVRSTNDRIAENSRCYPVERSA